MAELASVTIDQHAFGDPRFDYLAKLCGLADGDHARGKVERLWSMCTGAQNPTPPIAWIVACLGDAGPDALVTADLGERTADGQVRMKGCERLDWYGDRKQNQVAGGKARVKDAPRAENGQLLARAGASKKPAAASRRPAGDQQKPAPDPDLEPDLEPERGPPVLSLVPDDRRPPRASEGSSPQGDLIPDGYELPDTAQNRRAIAHAKERGVHVPYALAKFVERVRGERSPDWSSRARSWLLREDPTPPALVASFRRADRAAIDRAVRDREREARTQQEQRAAEALEDVRRAAQTAIQTDFGQKPEKATS